MGFGAQNSTNGKLPPDDIKTAKDRVSERFGVAVVNKDELLEVWAFENRSGVSAFYDGLVLGSEIENEDSVVLPIILSDATIPIVLKHRYGDQVESLWQKAEACVKKRWGFPYAKVTK